MAFKVAENRSAFLKMVIFGHRLSANWCSLAGRMGDQGVGIPPQPTWFLVPYNDQAVDILTQTMSALIELHRQHRELGLETVYWMEKYGFSRPSVPQLGELPDVNSLITTLAQLFTPLSSFGIDSEWARKRQELSRHPEQRQHQREEAAPVQARNPGERPVPRTTTIPVKPEHAEDHRPNKLQSLLRDH